MITFPQHAEKEMLKDGILKEEAEACLEHGELVIKQAVKGEFRYGKQLQLKDNRDIHIRKGRNKGGDLLHGKEEKMATKMKEGAIYCAKCDSEMRNVLLLTYEYLEGHSLNNVPAYKCPGCGNIFFTEEQAADMEQRTKALIESAFGFQRKITVTGRSLAVTIPQELASHMNLIANCKDI